MSQPKEIWTTQFNNKVETEIDNRCTWITFFVDAEFVDDLPEERSQHITDIMHEDKVLNALLITEIWYRYREVESDYF